MTMTTEALPQGDLRLLETDLARELLGSSIPARLAFVATDGTPRVSPRGSSGTARRWSW